MALGFIKKIFSFGSKPDAPASDEAAAETLTPPVETSADDVAERPETSNEPLAAPDGDPDAAPEAFTAETSPEAGLSTPEPEPETLETAGEPPLGEGGPADDHTADSDVCMTETVMEAPDAEALAAPETDARAEAPQTGTQDDDAGPALPDGFARAGDNAAAIAPAVPPVPERRLSWIERLRAGLSRSAAQLSGQITALFTKRKLDEATLQDLEDLLIQADLGVETALRVTDTLASERYGKDVSGEDVSRIMAREIEKVLVTVAKPLELDLNHKPHVILVVGVNGTGKTTTIGKLAAKLSRAGLKVTLAAGDTFRAAAIEQLHIWAERTGSKIVSTRLGADAAGLAFEAYEKARADKSDVLIIDTAGRLQNKTELMAELEKIVRVLGKLDPDAPHTVLQTLDATTGQNALNQVEIFRNVAGVNGLIMTKLDGTARGGILVAISAKHRLPVYFIGVGEGIDDLEPFDAKDFAEAIAGLS